MLNDHEKLILTTKKQLFTVEVIRITYEQHKMFLNQNFNV